jgi:hypothetical protein
MFFAANIPLLEDPAVLWENRRERFRAGLRHHLEHGVRPHMLYSNQHESAKKLAAPTILPPLRNGYFDQYHPEKGCLSVPSDVSVIRKLVEVLKPYMKFEPTGYVGEKDEKGRRQGKGLMVYENGNKYEGTFLDDLMHGYGRIDGASGNYYIGEWINNFVDGQGKYVYANGDVYVGSFKAGARCGYGEETRTDGLQYKGDWSESKKCGKGILYRFDPALRPDADKNKSIVFDGYWKDDQPEEAPDAS